MRLDYQLESSYIVTIVDDTPVACTCKAFQYNAMSGGYACKHMIRIYDAIAATVILAKPNL